MKRIIFAVVVPLLLAGCATHRDLRTEMELIVTPTSGRARTLCELY